MSQPQTASALSHRNRSIFCKHKMSVKHVLQAGDNKFGSLQPPHHSSTSSAHFSRHTKAPQQVRLTSAATPKLQNKFGSLQPPHQSSKISSAHFSRHTKSPHATHASVRPPHLPTSLQLDRLSVTQYKLISLILHKPQMTRTVF